MKEILLIKVKMLSAINTRSSYYQTGYRRVKDGNGSDTHGNRFGYLGCPFFCFLTISILTRGVSRLCHQIEEISSTS